MARNGRIYDDEQRWVILEVAAEAAMDGQIGTAQNCVQIFRNELNRHLTDGVISWAQFAREDHFAFGCLAWTIEVADGLSRRNPWQATQES